MTSQSEHSDCTFDWNSGRSWFSNRALASGARNAIFLPGVTPPLPLLAPHATALNPSTTSAAAILFAFI